MTNGLPPEGTSAEPEARASDDDVASTARLLAQARGGNSEALDVLFERHLPPLRRWASGRLPRWARDITDTEDLVQETVLQTFKRIETFEPRGEGALHAYLRQALLNRISSEFRHKGRTPAVGVLDSKIEDPGTSPIEAAIGQETLEHYERALGCLRPVEKDLIVSRVELDLTYQEIADAFGKPSIDAARKATVRALVQLADEMARLRA